MGPSPREIVKLNIQHFRRLLQTEKDPTKREMIRRLLAEQAPMLAAPVKKGSN